jgi:hypothetical protein
MNCVTAGVTSEGVPRVGLDMSVDYCSVVGPSHTLHAAVLVVLQMKVGLSENIVEEKIKYIYFISVLFYYSKTG